MIDPIYLALILCLRWLHVYFSRLRNPRLVPYFNRQGQLIGMVRVPPSNSREELEPTTHGPSPNNDMPDVDGGPVRPSRRLHTSVPQPVSSTPANITPETWDGWPDGRFQWKAIHRRCIGVLECRSPSCSFNLQVAPAARGVDLHRQLQKTCLCGEATRLRSCGIEYSTYLYRSGAFFVNSGNHTYPRYTHSLTYRPREPLEFEEYVVKRPISLRDSPFHVVDNSGSSEKTVSDVAPDGGTHGQPPHDEPEDLDFLARQELLDDPEADLALIRNRSPI
ncbi:hypothetical protein B0H14DRAFT_2739581 [Mycena olivaceomarginata]|nr:hypothetical protein B0H14DRAFT_2739581 [Mycena olivaceomarginata]